MRGFGFEEEEEEVMQRIGKGRGEGVEVKVKKCSRGAQKLKPVCSIEEEEDDTAILTPSKFDR